MKYAGICVILLYSEFVLEDISGLYYHIKFLFSDNIALTGKISLVSYDNEPSEDSATQECCSSSSKEEGGDIFSPREMFKILGTEIPTSFNRLEEYVLSKIKEEREEDSDVSSEDSVQEDYSSSNSENSVDCDIDSLSIV